MRLHAEFTTEPFVVGEDEAPAHAREAFRVAESAGLDSELGPFGTSISGDGSDLLGAIGGVLSAAFENGATRITLRVERADG
jgi:uncharacterized protein YqgV (UPF0045/DUF77 family)